MNNLTLKKIITGVVLFILLVIAIKFAVKVLLPIAIIVIAAYIVYMLVSGFRKKQ
jgi:predicted PurR-regulated permease PerM